MNLRLKDVLLTSSGGRSFSKHPEVFIRGNNIKSIQLPNDLIEKHISETKRKQAEAIAMRE